MRFSAIHKTTTYLMALAAWGAVALAPDADLAAIAIALPLFAVSWFLEPPRVSLKTTARLAIAWNVATVAFFAVTIMSILSGEPAVPSGIRFLSFLLVNKLCNRRSSKDYQQTYIITFLLLVAATTVNSELTYALCFVAYVVFATWALILFHLRREMEDNYLLRHSDDASSEKVEVTRILNSRRIVGRAFLAGTSLVSLGIFLGSILLFVFFPRVGFGMFFHQGRSGLTLAGFSDGVQLGGHGLIKDNPAVVMRVEVSGRLAGRNAPAQHWRGVAFDRYSRGRWSRTPEGWNTHLVVSYQEQRAYVYPQGTSVSLEDLTAQAARGAAQKIYLEPLDSPVLFAAGRPISFSLPRRRMSTDPALRGGLNDEVQLHHDSGIAYSVVSDIDPPPEAALAAAPDVNPSAPRFRAYLELPPELLPPDRPSPVVELARSITVGARGPYEKATRIEAYLRQGYGYTREMDTDDADEPLEHFLFKRKLGHCEYFSSAMAILLRAVGVPTRNVNGFYGGEWNEYGDYIAVRSGDAHSWVEVYFEGAGWTTWDPTPPAGREELSRSPGGFRAKLRRWFDTLRLKWFKWVIEYDLGRQLSVFKSLSRMLHLGAIKAALGQAVRAPGRLLRAHKLAAALAAAFLGGLAGLLWWRRRGGRPLLGRTTERRRRAIAKAEAIALYERTLDRLARRGHPKPPDHTGREFARQIRTSSVTGAGAFDELTEVYYLARFGEVAITSADVNRLAQDLVHLADPPQRRA